MDKEEYRRPEALFLSPAFFSSFSQAKQMPAVPSKTHSGSLTGKFDKEKADLIFCGCRPTVVTVVDSQGKMVPDRVRVSSPGISVSFSFAWLQVSWGRLENFKCVDYFQIEYYEKDDRVGKKLSYEFHLRKTDSHFQTDAVKVLR